MRTFKRYVLLALELMEPMQLNIVAPTHGPVLRDKSWDYVRRFRELASTGLRRDFNDNEKHLMVYYISSFISALMGKITHGEIEKKLVDVWPNSWRLASQVIARDENLLVEY
jgi:flavorubredoxin